MKYVLVPLLLVVFAACGEQSHIHPPNDSESVRSFQSSGQVLTIMPNHRYAKIAHHAIGDYMEAMTMTMKIEKPELIDNIAELDSIRFTLTVSDMDAYISAVEKIE